MTFVLFKVFILQNNAIQLVTFKGFPVFEIGNKASRLKKDFGNSQNLF